MFQPPFEMENGHNMINMSTMNDMQMIPFDENDPEVIARRIKNRERQRRYRARKRQEADMKRASYIISQPSQPSQQQLPETLVNNTPMEIVTRVYSQRNWKKDARRAHLLQQQQQQQQQQQNASSSTSTKESIDLRNLGNQSNFVDTRELSSTPSGRNWKAEARNKRK
ncbi:unnamed protein product [Lactuca virosa]|uniref:BZIP domain-containing protein n=1 Tax=Lactuca virosa TaxID=75947 RepID=A0AAU9M363_9ASTR|nr:unnamed protein product [Lactuca virosa]